MLAAASLGACLAALIAHPYLAALGLALVRAFADEASANPVAAFGGLAALIGLSLWCFELLEGRGWRAVLWAGLGVSGCAVLVAALPGGGP